MTHPTDVREERLTEREQSIVGARAALRAEREKLAADRVEADRLLAEARADRRDAARERDRARRLAGRLARVLNHREAEARRQIERREAALAADRQRFAAEVARCNAVRSEFHATAAATRDRLRDAWAAVESQQKRAATDWGEADRYFAEQTAALDARSADIDRREKELTDRRARGEADAAGLREEAAALELRVENARAALAELELRRDRARAELLGTELPSELLAVSSDGGDDLARREAELAREKAAVAALKASLDRETADLGDRRRVLTEQFAMLADARAKWHAAERQTVAEMEGVARDLRCREHDLDARERRLIRADVRRREDAHDLWQLRLRLEAWQTKLTAFEARWHAEREKREADLERRVSDAARREAELAETFAKWEKARAIERERLRAELDHWTADRDRLAKAAADFNLQRQLLDAELSTYAARALAAEELLAAAAPGRTADWAARRLAVLRKWWERIFDRKVREIDARRAESAAELAALGERYRSLHKLLAGVLEREAAVNNARAAADLAGAPSTHVVPVAAPDAELAALRGEVERIAVLMMELELPEPPDPPERELPWGFEESGAPPADVLPFDPGARAA
jgi:chromosome segregation ATPase